jgi:putative FmdB family regulatory protein
VSAKIISGSSGGEDVVPLYEYQCPECGRFERIQKFADAPLSECPTCGQAVQRLLSAPAIQFKGSGWYITDYARKGGSGASSAASTAGGEKSGESKPAESKSDTSSASTSSSDAAKKD